MDRLSLCSIYLSRMFLVHVWGTNDANCVHKCGLECVDSTDVGHACQRCFVFVGVSVKQIVDCSVTHFSPSKPDVLEEPLFCLCTHY